MCKVVLECEDEGDGGLVTSAHFPTIPSFIEDIDIYRQTLYEWEEEGQTKS